MFAAEAEYTRVVHLKVPQFDSRFLALSANIRLGWNVFLRVNNSSLFVWNVNEYNDKTLLQKDRID
jgi:hypothetical protein